MSCTIVDVARIDLDVTIADRVAEHGMGMEVDVPDRWGPQALLADGPHQLLDVRGKDIAQLQRTQLRQDHLEPRRREPDAPIATNLVDEVNDALVAAWIDRMPAPSRLDAAAVLRAACVTFRE